MRRQWFVLAGSVLALLYIASGIFNVEPDETGVTFLFGRVEERHATPGVHWNFPSPFGRRIIAKTATNLSVPIGFESTASDYTPSGRSSDLWITGGTSIVRARLNVQYMISDLADYALTVDQPIAFMRAAGEQVVTRLLTTLNVDDVLTTGRQILRQSLKNDLQLRLDAAHAGIKILSVNIDALSPPLEGEVEQAFQQVQSVRSDRERSIQNAMAERARTLADAQAKVQQLTSEAAAYRFSRIELAKSQSASFLALDAEYQRAPANTEERLYLEAIERILPKLRVYVVDPGRSGELHVRATK